MHLSKKSNLIAAGISDFSDHYGCSKIIKIENTYKRKKEIKSIFVIFLYKIAVHYLNR